MFRKSIWFAAAGLLLALGVFGAGTALAQSDPYNGRTFERSPSYGPPGTVISVSGTGCIENGQPYEKAIVRLARRASPDETPFDKSQDYPIHPDGTWGGDFVVPQEAPRDDYKLGADCQAADMVFPGPETDFYVGDSLPTTPSPTPIISASPASSPSPAKPTYKPSPSPERSPSVIAATPSPSPSPSPQQTKSPQAAPASETGHHSAIPILVVAAALVIAALSGTGFIFLRRRLSQRRDGINPPGDL